MPSSSLYKEGFPSLNHPITCGEASPHPSRAMAAEATWNIYIYITYIYLASAARAEGCALAAIRLGCKPKDSHPSRQPLENANAFSLFILFNYLFNPSTKNNYLFLDATYSSLDAVYITLDAVYITLDAVYITLDATTVSFYYKMACRIL